MIFRFLFFLKKNGDGVARVEGVRGFGTDVTSTDGAVAGRNCCARSSRWARDLSPTAPDQSLAATPRLGLGRQMCSVLLKIWAKDKWECRVPEVA